VGKKRKKTGVSSESQKKKKKKKERRAGPRLLTARLDAYSETVFKNPIKTRNEIFSPGRIFTPEE
jgi:hypothetical protein